MTGGGSRTAQACYRAFAWQGASVTVADLDVVKARETVRQIEVAGGTDSTVHVDFGSSLQVEATVQYVIQTYAHFDRPFCHLVTRDSRYLDRVIANVRNIESALSVDSDTGWFCYSHPKGMVLAFITGSVPPERAG